MIIKANDRIIIMPGSGINENNLCEVIHHTNAKEVHASAKATVSQPKMLFENKEIQNMGEELEISSEVKISLLLRKIKSMIQ
jgi:copper homeostasis protein